MTQIRITTQPQKTAQGVVRDFRDAVLQEHPHLVVSALYWFGPTAVQFYYRRNLIGATFYKPHSKYGFEVTQVDTKGIRHLKGFTNNISL